MGKRRLGSMGVLPFEMIWEILTWLPTKSLLRFKSVSKLWLSTILDPNFARAHRSPFRGLLVMNPDPSPILGWIQPTRDFFVANLDDAIDDEVHFSFQFRIPEDLRRFQASNMVNGIICFYSRNVAKLCNIATREIINLPKSKFPYRYSTYHLGFDPIGSFYKLLRICPIYKKEEEEAYLDHPIEFMEWRFGLGNIKCEILTLGVDSSWRSINPPPNSIIPHGLCVDGVLYWMIAVPGNEPRNYAIYTFNLAGERFHSISNPPDGCDDLRLLQFGASVAMAACKKHRIMITHYDVDNGSWTEIMSKLTVKPLPTDLSSGIVARSVFPNGDLFGDVFYDLIIRGLLPNGDLMMYKYNGVETGSGIYVFDEKRNYLQEFITMFPASDITLTGRICLYEENILSLKRLTGF